MTVTEEVIKLIDKFNETGEIDESKFFKAMVPGFEPGHAYVVDLKGNIIDIGWIQETNVENTYMGHLEYTVHSRK